MKYHSHHFFFNFIYILLYYITFYYKIVSEVQIEGGYKKPTWKDIFIIRLAFFPYDIFIWSKKFYRRKFQRDQVSIIILMKIILIIVTIITNFIFIDVI